MAQPPNQSFSDKPMFGWDGSNRFIEMQHSSNHPELGPSHGLTFRHDISSQGIAPPPSSDNTYLDCRGILTHVGATNPSLDNASISPPQVDSNQAPNIGIRTRDL